MGREEKVINYYCLCNKLKNTIRTGWKKWNVQRDRIESVAEHIFGTQMLAIAMKSEYQYDVDIMKVIYMLAIHELGEIIINDLTPFDISIEKKEEIEHKAVHDILKELIDGEEIEKLFLEFDAHQTKESLFAFQCDKLECDLQCKLYDQENCVDLKKQDNNEIMDDELVRKMVSKGDSWSSMWLEYGQIKYPYDESFRAVSNYAKNNKIGNK